MTPAELVAIQLRAAAARTFKAWHVCWPDGKTAEPMDTAKELICTDIPALVAEAERLRAGIDDVLQAWGHGWDCSRTPGHEPVQEAMIRLASEVSP